MTVDQQNQLRGLPTYHSICFTKFGISRPGKTAKDLAMAAIRAKEKKENKSND
jgi:hypothetical protein